MHVPKSIFCLRFEMFFNLYTTCKSRGRWIGSSAPGAGKGICRGGEGIFRHAQGARPQDFRLFSKSDTPFQHFLCPTGSGPDYNFINSGCSFYNAPQILAKGVGFSVANPQFLALSPHPLGGALLNEGEGSPNNFDPPPEKYCEYRTTQIIGLFSFSMQIL